jgi:sucrose-6-phosphate hydrolase SacC (GH32 family)
MSEAFRPAIHFTPRRGWINDPNGLVWFNGEWHLFYQFFDATDADGMQWGHAISRDLLRWEHLPPAIRPDRFGHIWSGSAVVDRRDTSGLFGGRPGLVRRCSGTRRRAAGSWLWPAADCASSPRPT